MRRNVICYLTILRILLSSLLGAASSGQTTICSFLSSPSSLTVFAKAMGQCSFSQKHIQNCGYRVIVSAVGTK